MLGASAISQFVTLVTLSSQEIAGSLKEWLDKCLALFEP
jgi:hypothetical protein